MSNLHLYSTEKLISEGKRLKWLLDEARIQNLVDDYEDLIIYHKGIMTYKAMQEEYKKRIKKEL